MNAKTIVPLGLAMVLGLVAAKLVMTAVQHKPATVAQASNLVGVVVAKRDVPPGGPLGKDDLTTAKVPADAAPGGVFASVDQLVGRVPMMPLVKGQTVIETLLAPTGSGSGLQSLIPSGMRAVTLQVDEYSGVGGMIEPGCRVDVVAQLRDEKSGHQVVRTVLQNIKVTAVGKNVAPPKPPVAGEPVLPPSTSITLLCQPRQAQALELSQMAGRPWLVLRSTRDTAEPTLDGTTLAELSGRTEADSTAPATPMAVVPTTNPVAVLPTTNPVAVATAVPTNPNVEPVVLTKRVKASVPATIRRTVTQIRGGVVTQVTFDEPNPAAAKPEADKPDPAKPDADDASDTSSVGDVTSGKEIPSGR